MSSQNLLVILLLLSVSLGVLFSHLNIHAMGNLFFIFEGSKGTSSYFTWRRDIATELHCSKTLVHNAIAKFIADGMFNDGKRPGHPRKTNNNGRPLNERDSNVFAKVLQHYFKTFQ